MIRNFRRQLLPLFLLGITTATANADPFFVDAAASLGFKPTGIRFIVDCLRGGQDAGKTIVSSGLVREELGPRNDVVWRGAAYVGAFSECTQAQVTPVFTARRLLAVGTVRVVSKESDAQSFMTSVQLAELIAARKEQLLQEERDLEGIQNTLSQLQERADAIGELGEVIEAQVVRDRLQRDIALLQRSNETLALLVSKAALVTRPHGYEARLAESSVAISTLARKAQELRGIKLEKQGKKRKK